MRKDWGIKKLEEVCNIIGGGTPSKKNVSYYNGSILWASVRDMNCDLLVKTEHSITEEGLKNSSSNLIPKGELIIATRVGLGKACILNADTAINQDLKGVIPKTNSMDRIFLFYWYKSIADKVLRDGKGMTVKGVNVSYVKNLNIPIPTLNEQQQIVTILDKTFAEIDQAKANVEQNIKNTEELFQSKLNEIFSQQGEGWEEKKLIEVNRFIDYRGRTPKKTESGIKLITAKNVRMGFMRNEPEEFIAESDYDDWMTRGIPKKGDVLFTTEAPLANVALLNTNEKIALAQRIITLCPNRELLSGEYLTYCLQSKVIQDKILAKGTGATVTGIKSKLLKEILIPIPSLKSQNEIVIIMNQIRNYSDKVINILQNKFDSLDELKKSILQKAFAGALTSPNGTAVAKDGSIPSVAAVTKQNPERVK